MTTRWLLVLLGFMTCWMSHVDGPAEAATCNLTTAGSSCSIGSALFMQAESRPTGSGVIDSFVRIQNKGSEHRYNPEPTSLLLVGSGLAGFAAWRSRRVTIIEDGC